MRALATLALSVCLAGGCLAQDGKINTNEQKGEWFSANHAGSEAFRQAKWADALEAFQKAWPLATSPVQQAITANDLGATLHTLGRPADALPWYRRAVGLWHSQNGRAIETLESGLGLADTLRALGDFRGTEKEMRDLLSLKVPVNYKAALLNSLGDLLREQARKAEARNQFHAALALGPLSPVREIDATLGLGDIDRETGNRTQAMDAANRVVSLARETTDPVSEALGLRLMGRIWADQGDYARAEPVLRRSLSIFQQQPLKAYRQIAAGLNCLAVVYRDEGKFSLAEEAWLQAIATDEKLTGPRHPQVAMYMESLAGVYTLQNRFTDAADLASQALSIMTEAFGSDSLAAAGALSTLGYVAQGEKRLETAASNYAQALETFRAKADPADRHVVETKDRYASVLAALHRNDEAKRLRQEIKAFRLK